MRLVTFLIIILAVPTYTTSGRLLRLDVVDHVELDRLRTIEYIKEHEGLRLTPYYCAAGVQSIGYGHVIKQGEATHINAEQADSVLAVDFAYCLDVARRDGFHGHQRLAIAHFLYCFGETKWNKSKLRKAIKSQDYDLAVKLWRRWIHCNKKPLPALSKQRDYEITLFFASLRWASRRYSSSNTRPH